MYCGGGGGPTLTALEAMEQARKDKGMNEELDGPNPTQGAKGYPILDYWMFRLKERRSQRDWDALPIGYEREAVKNLADSIMPHLKASGFQWEKRARRLVRNSETFSELIEALTP